MKNEIVAFAIGALLGGVSSYYICKSYFDEQIKKEFAKDKKEKEKAEKEEKKKKEDWEKVKENVSKNSREENPKKQSYKGEKGSIDEYLNTVRHNSYIPPNAPIRPSEDTKTDIKIIPPDEIGDDENYDVISLTYYAKADLVADELDEFQSAKEIKDMIGEDWIHHFGEYDEDSVCIKNDVNKAYYEVLLSTDDVSYGSHPEGGDE